MAIKNRFFEKVRSALSSKIDSEVHPPANSIFMFRLPTGSLLLGRLRSAKPTGSLPNGSSFKVDMVDRIVVPHPSAGHGGLT
jgi:hypothetical protein